MKSRVSFAVWLLGFLLFAYWKARSYFLQTFELSSPRFRVKLTRFRWQESVRPFCRLARSEGGETDTGCTHQPLSIALSLTLSAPPVFSFMLFAYIITIPCQKMSSKETFAWQYRKLDMQMGIVFPIVTYTNLNAPESNLCLTCFINLTVLKKISM